ncbi:MAG: cytochrome c [Aestuariivirga sp.]|nr:cytochrome c [Aestuariivirga sp.]
MSRADDIAAGKKLVEDNCSRCHAIGVTGNSPLAKAPPFREVVTRYPPESLGEALVEGIVTGHNEMPEFVFEADQAMEIIAYLDSLIAK